MARIDGLQRLGLRNVASAHYILGEFGAAEEGPSEVFGWRTSASGSAELIVEASVEPSSVTGTGGGQMFQRR